MAPWHENPWLRFLAYLLSVVLLFQVLVWIASAGDDALRLFVKPNPGDVFGTSEFSLVEAAQSLVLAACALVMGWHSRSDKEVRSLGIVLALGLLIMLIREQDYHLDRWLSWEWLALVAAGATAMVVRRNHAAIRRQARGFAKSAGFGLFFAGLTIAVGFSRVFGQKALWIALMDAESYRIVKLAAEEMTELLGYCLILAGCIEFGIWARGGLDRLRQTDDGQRQTGNPS
jgi:hypothetical protein